MLTACWFGSRWPDKPTDAALTAFCKAHHINQKQLACPTAILRLNSSSTITNHLFSRLQLRPTGPTTYIVQTGAVEWQINVWIFDNIQILFLTDGETDCSFSTCKDTSWVPFSWGQPRTHLKVFLSPTGQGAHVILFEGSQERKAARENRTLELHQGNYIHQIIPQQYSAKQRLLESELSDVASPLALRVRVSCLLCLRGAERSFQCVQRPS